MTDRLITSLEQAGEGSRELDGRIWCARNGYTFVMWDGAGCVYRERPRCGISHISQADVAPVTTSLDAALTLAERLGLDGWNTLYAAMMNWKAHDPRGPLSQTLPLALCLAILKATNPKGQPNV